MSENAELQAAVKWAQYVASARGIKNMLELAKPDLAVVPGQFDKDPWLLNCPNGTLDLRTGKLREHCVEDYLTKLCATPYEPDVRCPVWQSFLDTIFAGNVAMIAYLQRLSGYWLTGDVREQILPIFWGTGSNGKSTFIEVGTQVVGEDYWITADRSIVIAKKNESGHSTEKMDLFGRRLAVVMETEEGQQFAEAFVKQLTGGDTYRGRNLYERTWQFKPTHKVVLVTNHKPRVKATDHAFWRRIKLVHFGVTIPDEKPDKTLPEKLKAEAQGILAWMVRGCLDWQRDGLAEPQSIRDDTKKYRSDEDLLGRFIRDCCIVAPAAKVKLKVLRERYEAWCKERGEHEVSGRRFGEYLKGEGFGTQTSNGTWYLGIGVIEYDAGGDVDTDEAGVARW
jgi:putative DNA primase/helicase